MVMTAGCQYFGMQWMGWLDGAPWKKTAVFAVQGLICASTFYHLSTTYSKPIETESDQSNPFYNETWRPSLIQRIKMSFCASTLLPIRVVTLLSTLLITLGLSKLVVLGCSEEELLHRPLSKWRLLLRSPMPFLSRLMLFFGVVVREKGTCAPASEAPILVGAPHICMLEPFALMGINSGMAISRIENARMPLMGSFMMAGKGIFVDKADPESKKKVASTIESRAKSPEWHSNGPVALFPEA